MDDNYAVIKKNDVEKTFDILNKQHPNIEFDLAMEKESQSPVLDLLLKRKPNKEDLEIYRKSTKTKRVISRKSPLSTALFAGC